MPDVTVTTDGTLTVPPAVCAALGLRPGDTVTFTPLPDGTVLVQPRGQEPTPPVATKPPVRFGFVSGLTVPDDFDNPLPSDVLRSFEGR